MRQTLGVHAPLGVHAILLVLGGAISAAQLYSNFLRCSVQPGFLDEWTTRQWWEVQSPLPRGALRVSRRDVSKCVPGRRASFPQAGFQPYMHTETKSPFPTWEAVGWRPKMMSFNGFHLEQIFVCKLHTPLKIKGNSFLKVLGLLHSTKFP